jgi:hypothetical protein
MGHPNSITKVRPPLSERMIGCDGRREPASRKDLFPAQSTHPADLAPISRVPGGGGIQETTAKRVDSGGEMWLGRFVQRAEPGERRKAAAGLSVHKIPFREVPPPSLIHLFAKVCN